MPLQGNTQRPTMRALFVSLIVLLLTTPDARAQDSGPKPAAGPTTLPAPRPMPMRRAPQAFTLDTGAFDAPSRKEQQYLLERIDPERTLDLTVGRPSVLRFRTSPFRDQVADPEVADVLNLTETELSVTGKKVGVTVLNLWFKNPNNPKEQEVLSYLVRVSDDPEQSRQFDLLLENLERDLNRGFPDSVVDLSYVGSQVVVRGKARDIEEATHLLRIISQSLPTDDQADQAASVIAANSQNPNAPSLLQPNAVQPTSFEAIDGFTIDEITDAGGLDSIMRGDTPSGANPTRINNLIVNMLEIAGVHQVMLKVTLAEVVRDSGRSLVANTRFGADAGATSDVSFTQETGLGRLTFQTEDFFLRFDALKRLGLARSLSEPNLTTLSGQSANFLVGGQFPIVETASNNVAVSQNVRFIPFGVQLSVLPTVTDGDRVRLQLQASISEIPGGGIGAGNQNNNSNPQNNNPSQPPTLTTRTFASTVELRDTESLALAGLIRSSLTNTSARVPFLGDVPVLGNLFSQNRASFQEQELLVVVTPCLVAPVPASQPLAIPGSDVFEPDDVEFYIFGSVNGSIPEDYRSAVRSDASKMQSFRKSEQRYIIGRPGHSSGRPLPACPAPANQMQGQVNE